MEAESYKRGRSEGSANDTCSRYPKRQPGGYRCKINQPIGNPSCLLGCRVSVKLDQVEAWKDGILHGFSKCDWKHDVEYDDGSKAELRVGLDAPVRVDIDPDMVRAAGQRELGDLLRLLQQEADGQARLLAATTAKDARQHARSKLDLKRRQMQVVQQLIEQDLAAQAAAAEAAAAEAASKVLPVDCPVMQRVGPGLCSKWQHQQQQLVQPPRSAASKQQDSHESPVEQGSLQPPPQPQQEEAQAEGIAQQQQQPEALLPCSQQSKRRRFWLWPF